MAEVPDSNFVSRGVFDGKAHRLSEPVAWRTAHAAAPTNQKARAQMCVPAGNGAGGWEVQVTRSAEAVCEQSRCENPQPLGGRTKRLLDLVVAGSALLAAVPLMLFVALLIMATSGGPVFFAHRRIGFNGVPFNCYKFRTMVRNADQVLQEYLEGHPQAGREWRENRKLMRDPRITFLGQMLRKSSVDELPQLFNILRGDMSCVGPRPIVAEELQRYGALAAEYLSARPGLTGLWQVRGRNSVDYETRILLDTQYVRSWTLWCDISILARTTVTVMKFEQAS